MDHELKEELINAIKYSRTRTRLPYNSEELEKLDLERRAAKPSSNLTKEEIHLLVGKLGKVLREISKSEEP